MFHEVTLIGFVGADPELHYTENGAPFANFSVATRQAVSKERVETCPQGWQESLNGKNWELTTWIRVTVWRKLAEAVSRYVAKGSQVYVRGELKGEAADGTQNPRIWVGSGGEHRASYEITARTVKFLGRRDNGDPPVGEAPPQGYEEYLPF
jgi:single-strand DNA-binding protein